MATATTTSPAAAPAAPQVPEGEQRVLLRGVGWEGYETLLRLVGDGHVRITYDRGDAELMSPSPDHEFFKTVIARLIETVTVELDVPCEGYGSTTWRERAKEQGIGPDECYYLANSHRVAGRKAIDLANDPPPDLALEVEISRGSLDKMAVYAGLGVSEVWRFDGETLRIARLRPDGTYEEVAASPSLPWLTPADVARWVKEAEGTGQTAWVRRVRAWVRDEVRPRLGGPR